VLADVRVDDHPVAPQELARLVRLNDLMFGTPTDVQPLEGELAKEVTARLASIGYAARSPAVALATWASAENYETRLSPDGIDAKVLAALREAST
jgi:uncharacterized Ntn-hydrolase superfamily protein